MSVVSWLTKYSVTFHLTKTRIVKTSSQPLSNLQVIQPHVFSQTPANQSSVNYDFSYIRVFAQVFCIWKTEIYYLKIYYVLFSLGNYFHDVFTRKILLYQSMYPQKILCDLLHFDTYQDGNHKCGQYFFQFVTSNKIKLRWQVLNLSFNT